MISLVVIKTMHTSNLGEGCSLNGNGLQRLKNLNGWFSVGGTVWEGLGVALLEGCVTDGRL